ncbi:MAG TPA: hypothetical protein VFE03_07155 [Caulobacteraceae bacterium]|jgi:hypothetical protein|nr:hypothetical protein [Caulobacteraceae bacterium]
MKRAAACLAIASLLVSAPASTAFAGTNPVTSFVDDLVAAATSLITGVTSDLTTQGQPGVECDDFANRPGNSAEAPGSAFNEDGVAGDHYAGEQPQNSNNPKSVSQYDTACAKIPSNQ